VAVAVEGNGYADAGPAHGNTMRRWLLSQHVCQFVAEIGVIDGLRTVWTKVNDVVTKRNGVIHKNTPQIKTRMV
jgi:hypothetical protein